MADVLEHAERWECVTCGHEWEREAPPAAARVVKDAHGTVLTDVAVFRAAYRQIGLGWLYAPSGWPVLRQLSDGLYGLWARWRLAVTGRPSLDQLCSCRGNGSSKAMQDQP